MRDTMARTCNYEFSSKPVVKALNKNFIPNVSVVCCLLRVFVLVFMVVTLHTKQNQQSVEKGFDLQYHHKVLQLKRQK